MPRAGKKARPHQKQKSRTLQQEDFCREYVANGGNAAEAYRTVYPKSKTWKPQSLYAHAHKMVSKNHIDARIKELRQEAAFRSEISVDRVLTEEKCLSYFDPKFLFDLKTGTLIPPYELPEDVRRAIAGFEAIELLPHGKRNKGNGIDDGTPRPRYKFKYKFWDKGKSLERISKHLGLYEKDNQQKAIALFQVILGGLPEGVVKMLQDRLLKVGQMDQGVLPGSTDRQAKD